MRYSRVGTKIYRAIYGENRIPVDTYEQWLKNMEYERRLLRPPEAKPKLDNIVLTTDQQALIDASPAPQEAKENLIAAMRDINMAARGSRGRSAGTRGRGGRASSGKGGAPRSTSGPNLPPRCAGCGGCHVERPCPTELKKRAGDWKASADVQCTFKYKKGPYAGKECRGRGHTEQEHQAAFDKMLRIQDARQKSRTFAPYFRQQRRNGVVTSDSKPRPVGNAYR